MTLIAILSNSEATMYYIIVCEVRQKFNAANNGRLVVVIFVQQWQSHAQKARLQGCSSHEVADVATLLSFVVAPKNSFLSAQHGSSCSAIVIQPHESQYTV